MHRRFTRLCSIGLCSTKRSIKLYSTPPPRSGTARNSAIQHSAPEKRGYSNASTCPVSLHLRGTANIAMCRNQAGQSVPSARFGRKRGRPNDPNDMEIVFYPSDVSEWGNPRGSGRNEVVRKGTPSCGERLSSTAARRLLPACAVCLRGVGHLRVSCNVLAAVGLEISGRHLGVCGLMNG